MNARVTQAERLKRAASTRTGVPLLLVTIPLDAPPTVELAYDCQRDKAQLLSNLRAQPRVLKSLRRLGFELEAVE